MNPLHAHSWDLYKSAMADASHRVALDIGANDGGYTKTLLEAGFRVYAFEPVPEMFDKLSMLCLGRENAHLIRAMVSDEVGYKHDVRVLEAWSLGQIGDGGLSECPTKYPPFDVPVVTIDSMMLALDVGVIKLDVDGYELKVLRGAERTISKTKPPILCELSCYIEKIGGGAEQFCEQVFKMGYRIVSMDGSFECRNWKQVKPHWPWHSSFDVMLIPN